MEALSSSVRKRAEGIQPDEARQIITPVRVAMLGLCLSMLAGCSSVGESRVINESVPISESVRASFGRIALLPDPASRESHLRYPHSADQSAPHALPSSGKGEVVGDFDGVPFVGVDETGVVESLFAGLPRPKVESDAGHLKRALQESPLLPGLIQRLQSGLQTLGRDPLPCIPENVAAPLLAQPLKVRDYRTLASCDCDSVMELAVYRQAFRAERWHNPPIAFEASVHVYVTRVSDGTLLYVQPFDYRTRKYSLGQWADRDGRRFRAELEKLRREAARAILEQLF